MAARIVLFGATGYTGRLTAEAMVERGLRPVLAARTREKCERLAEELGAELETARADVADPPSVTELVERGDVLVTTVGPFVRFGAPAAAAASTVGAHYLDSTGEPPFVREVFERYGPVAEGGGCGMVTAFGYDWVPGNLAGALALERAGDAAVRVDSGYFITGGGSMSGGTKASLVGAIASDSFAFRDGRVRTERGAARMRTFPVGSKELGALSVGSSEHFTLPRIAPQLREVNAYLGWFGPASRAMQVVSAGTSVAMKLPGVEALWSAAGERLVKGSTGGPDANARAKGGSHIVAIAYDDGGRELSEVHVTGIDGYTFTGRILAWGAERAAAGELRGTGALGPVDGFGLEALVEGCAAAGIGEQDGGSQTVSSSPDTELADSPAG
ncbi:MAG TPA: saccharopine dehydrogenase NADP-binding domain-containing protein [Thermoleophilaceae bacterium]|nr:saccharopine dehydrogenase NADP-binding domain-containing protein [Thermoleophilaceae bacterium]